MGVNNRQRRAAKQKKRRQQSRGESRGISLDEILWACVDTVLQGSTHEVGLMLDALDSWEPAFDDILRAAIARQRGMAMGHGWSESDLDELRERQLKVPLSASDRQRELRWLALLGSIPPLPPVAPRSTVRADDAMLAKIRALLAKAESTTFPEEAEALSAKAQELMARHRIEHVLVDGDDVDEPVGRRIWLDDPYADAKAQVLAAVAAANSCRSIMLTGLGCAHVVGFPSDLDVVELLHTSLLVQATTAMAAAGPQQDGRGRSRTRSFRQSFLVAYAWRIGERLADASTAVANEIAAREATLLPALVRREARVEAATAHAFPDVARKHVSVTNQAGWVAGTVAADAADLAAGPRLPEAE
jgi:hypothetical protein